MRVAPFVLPQYRALPAWVCLAPVSLLYFIPMANELHTFIMCLNAIPATKYIAFTQPIPASREFRLNR